MVIAALSLSRLFSQSIAGTALWRPLFCRGGTQIRRNARQRPTSLLAVSERSNLISPDFQLSPNPSLPQRSNRVRGRASNGDKEPGGSAFFATSLASEAERFVYSDEATTSTINDIAVVTPLCERLATHLTCLEDLLQWRRKAEELAASVGREFYEADGGPDSSDLLRELEWLLDDAVAACCRRGREADSDVGHWEACSWRDVKACLPMWSVHNLLPVTTSSDTGGNSSKESLDVSQEFGAFGTLLKDRYTDPVAELAADGACCCDSLRDSLADMASNEELEVEGGSPTTMLGKFPGLEDAVKRLGNRTTSAHILLRTSIQELESLWKQRVRDRRPFQYIVGCAHWRDLVLSVQEGILIPRPETEQMIDLAEAAIAADTALGGGIWADLGTGSGALAVSLARLLQPSGSVVAVDASPIAVAVTRHNVDKYSVTDRVTIVHGSWFTPLESQKGTLAGVLSNPPYIPSANLVGLQAEVGQHEPQSALDGGDDGMYNLREICEGSSHALRGGGFLALETNGDKQAEDISDLLHSLKTVANAQTAAPISCFQDIRIVSDFAGIKRFVVATRCCC